MRISKTTLLFLIVALFGSFPGITNALNRGKNKQQVPSQQTQSVAYKIVGSDTLNLTIFHPDNYKKNKKYPTIIFFFGGGWKAGSVKQFKPQATYFASRGMITILADYRVESRQGTTPFDATRDAKSAIRYLREHAKELSINKNKIVASGGSAGGHLAAATGNIVGLEEPNENLQISSKPNALILFNPVFDNGPEGYGYERIGDRYEEISPIHNIKKGAPPTIVFLGTKDKLIPVSTAERYKKTMEEVGSRCELFLYNGQPHGFFNFRNHKYYNATVYQADLFLTSLGYIKGEPTLSKE